MKTLKIVLTGPESTGKTTLANELSIHYSAPMVPEFARQYIEQLNRNYEESDLFEIAKGQILLENAALETPSRLLICDTNLLTIKIWALYKYHRCNDWILREMEQQKYDFYFLCNIDIPWEFDEQRENPNDRLELFQLYENEINIYKKKYTILSGNANERFEIACKKIDALLHSSS